MSSPSTPNDDKKVNFSPRKKKVKGTSQATVLRRKTRDRIERIREMRMNRMSPLKIMKELGISRLIYDKLMNIVEEEDAELLKLQSSMRLQSELARLESTADIIIAANLDIVRDTKLPPYDRQESSKIAFDAAMSVVKMHAEGPRILRDVFEPIREFILREDKHMPLPRDQQHRDKEFMEKYGPYSTTDKNNQQQQQQ